jgi:16S rRNA (uracil1498-N3)-methyltransferase
MRRRFFVESFEGRRAVLRGDRAHHLARVLRARAGQLYELSDGEHVWLAEVERAGREEVVFALVEQLAAARAGLETVLLLAIVKYDRFEWALEKATELSASEIVPLDAARSEKGLVEAAPRRTRRWEKILLEAAQQSRRLRPPVLHSVVEPAEAFRVFAADASVRVKEAPLPTLKLFYSESAEAPSLRSAIESARPAGGSVPGSASRTRWGRAVVAIGPEGGWTDTERQAALESGFLEVSLGPAILRTETAVAAALAAVNYALGE